MTLIFRRWTRVAGAGAACLALFACGKASDTPATATASPTPVPTAAPTPTPTPTPAPTTDPNGLAAGPGVAVKAYLKTIETPERGSNQYREAQKDADGVFMLYVGEYVVIDSTPRNVDGQVCRWRKDPFYSWNNDDDMMEVKSSSDPFFFKLLVAAPGYAEVTSRIDGVDSNDVRMRATVRR